VRIWKVLSHIYIHSPTEIEIWKEAHLKDLVIVEINLNDLIIVNICFALDDRTGVWEKNCLITKFAKQQSI